MALSTVMTHHHHAYLCQKMTPPLPLIPRFASISQRMSTRSTIDDYECGASIAITRGISTSNVVFLTNSATSKDRRNASSPHNIAFTSLQCTQSVLTMGCTACGCGSRNNERSASESEGDKELGGLKYAWDSHMRRWGI